MEFVAQQEPAERVSENRRELSVLLSNCGVYRVQSALFSFSGPDRIRWLNGMVSNNIRDLAANHGVYSFVLNAQGHILGDLYAFNRGESLTLEIDREQSEKLVQILRRYIIMDKVDVDDLSGRFSILGIAGPNSNDVLRSLGFDGQLEKLEFADFALDGVGTTIVRGDNPIVPNYELWVPAESADGALNALQRGGAELIGSEGLESFRIASGIPRMGREIRERTLPQETGQARALNFSKGCYIGQEIVERIRARGSVHRMLVGFEVEGQEPSPETKIRAEGKEVGEVTSVLRDSLGGKRLALGFLRKEYLQSGVELQAGEAHLKPVTLPFPGISGEAQQENTPAS